MNQRERILLIGLVAVFLIGGAQPAWRILLSPISNRQSTIENLRRAQEGKQDEELRIMAARRKLGQWKQQSLPPERLDAAALYENWLLELALNAKLQNVNIDRNPITKRKDTFALIGMTVTAKGTLSQLADFLFAYQRADLLQKIRTIDLRATGAEGDPVLDIIVVSDAVSVNDADHRDALFEEGRKEVVSKLMQDKTREQYAALTQKNLFARGYNGPPPKVVEKKPTPKEPEKPGIDVAEHVVLVGYVAKGESRDVVLYDRTKNRSTELREGEDFDVAGVKGKVLAIGPDFFTMQIDGEVWRLKLGQNLRQIEKVSETEAKPADPSTVSTR